MDNQKNLLLAVVFSLIILIGFDFFFGPNKNIVNENIPKDNEKIQRDDADAPTIDEDTFVKKSEKLNVNEKRIKFKAERIRGSINLFGGTIDDIILNDYFESIKKKKMFVSFIRKTQIHLIFFGLVGLLLINH